MTRAVLLALLLAACSPEATRTRGGPGSDVGNRGADVVLHDERRPYFATPERGFDK